MRTEGTGDTGVKTENAITQQLYFNNNLFLFPCTSTNRVHTYSHILSVVSSTYGSMDDEGVYTHTHQYAYSCSRLHDATFFLSYKSINTSDFVISSLGTSCTSRS